MSDPEELRWKDVEPGEAGFAAQWRAYLRGNERHECPEPSLLLAVRTEAIPEQVRQAVLAHLERCPSCQTLARDLAAEELSGLPDEARERIRAGIPREEPRRRAAIRGWWVWAGIPVAASLVIGFLLFRSPAPRPDQPAGTSTAAAPAPAERTSSPLRLTKPPIQLPATALLFRGGGEAAGENALLEGMAAFRRDDYATAARLLRRAAKQEPRVAEAHFYLGVSLLFLERNSEAAAALESAEAIAEGELAREAAWYLAIALHARGDRQAAARSLEKLCRMPGARHEEACRALADMAP